jgi:hypothetical protein
MRRGKSMKRSATVLLSLLIAATPVGAQSAYAKFDSKGRTIGLYNLLADATGCEPSQVFSGVIGKVAYDVRQPAYTYTFVLNAKARRVTLNLITIDDEILQPDVADIILKNVRVRVRARQCGSGTIWSTEEVRRL